MASSSSFTSSSVGFTCPMQQQDTRKTSLLALLSHTHRSGSLTDLQDVGYVFHYVLIEVVDSGLVWEGGRAEGPAARVQPWVLHHSLHFDPLTGT